MRNGLTISVIGHAAALLWALVSFGAKPHDALPVDSMPVDIISASELSQMTAGVKNAPKPEAAKPLVEKVGEPKPADNMAAKVTDKPEIVTASAHTAEPVPEPKPVEPKPAPKAKPEPPKPEAENKPEPKAEAKPDPNAEALKKAETKKDEKKAEQKKAEVPVPKKPPPRPLDFRKIEQKLALLDKRDAQRHAYAGETLNATPTLGTSTGHAPQLSQNEIDALRARLRECWNIPAGATDAKDLNIEVRILLKQDGSLSAEPKVLNRSGNPFFQVAAESALRAVRTCAPFDFLPVAKYDAWKDIEINFDPQFMFRS